MKYFSFQWHITDACDQRCQHCYIYSNNQPFQFHQASLTQMHQIVNNCIDTCSRLGRLPYLSITGGDPILHPSFWDLLQILHDNNIPFNILGNPFHLTKDICQKLHDSGCQKYQLSLDGLEPTHDSIRKPGSYAATIEKISLLQSANICCAIMTTVSKINIKEIPALIDVVVKHNVDVFSFARYCPVSHETDLMVSPQEYRNLLDQCWSKFVLYKNRSTAFNLKDHLWTLYLYEKGLFHISPDLNPNTIYEGCNCAINHMTILSDGTVYACRRMETPIGNALQDSLFDLFNSDKLNQYRQYDHFEKCSKCELLRFCRGCPATAHGLTGNMYSADPQCWKIIQ